MAFHVKDRATDQAVRRLAQLKGKTLTETIREAVEHEYQRERAQVPLPDRTAAADSGEVRGGLASGRTAGG
jgi:antitoxin VapB